MATASKIASMAAGSRYFFHAVYFSYFSSGKALIMGATSNPRCLSR